MGIYYMVSPAINDIKFMEYSCRALLCIRFLMASSHKKTVTISINLQVKPGLRCNGMLCVRLFQPTYLCILYVHIPIMKPSVNINKKSADIERFYAYHGAGEEI